MKKKIKYLFVSAFIVFVALISIDVKAEGTTKLKIGKDVNNLIRELTSGNCHTIDDNGYYYSENICNYFKKITRVNSLPDSFPGDNYRIVSIDGATPVYIWSDPSDTTGEAYIYSEADTIYLNENSRDLFAGLNLVDQDYSIFNTSQVTNMYGMFEYNDKVTTIDLSSWDTSNVGTMEGMFAVCSKLTDVNLSSFNTRKVGRFNSMFDGCASLVTVDVSSFETASDANTTYMFGSAPSLRTIYVSDAFYVNSTSVSLFAQSTNLIGGMGTTYDFELCGEYDTWCEGDTIYAHIDGGPSNPGYFTLKTDEKVTVTYMADETVFDTKEVTKYTFILQQPGDGEPEKEGYTFVGWYKDSGLTTPFDFEKTRIYEDTTIYAKFVENKKITIGENAHGTVLVTNTAGNSVLENGVLAGTTVTINVTPEDGFTFRELVIKDMEGTVVGTHNALPVNLVVATDVAIDVTYDELPRIDTTNNSNGTVSITDSNGNPINGNHVEPGTEITATVTPDSGYEVNGVSVKNGNGEEICGSTTNTVTCVINGNVTIEPNIVEQPKITIPNNDNLHGTVEVKDNNGDPITNGHAPNGTDITIDVTAEDGYEVEKVIIKDKDGNTIVEIPASELPKTYHVTGDIQIEPVINKKPEITIPNNIEHGKVTVTDKDGNPVTSPVSKGTTVVIDATAEEGYELKKVIIKDKDGNVLVEVPASELPKEYQVNEDIEIEPVINKKPEINVPKDDEHGKVDVTDSNGNSVGGYVEPGTTVTINVTPKEGYEVEKVIITNLDGSKTEIDGKDLPYNLVVTGDITIEPVYREKPTINLPENNEEDKGTVKVTDSKGNEIKNGDRVSTGEEIIVDVTPKENYKVEKVIIKDKDGNEIEVIPGTELPKKIKVNGPIIIEPVYAFDYKIIDGDGQTYVKGSNKEIVIKCNGVLEDFNGIEIDNGNPVDAANYVVESGSTILTLKSSFLEASSIGEHTITFNYKDGGSVEAKLTVAEEVVVPTTKDNIILSIITLIISTIVMMASYILMKRRYN